MQISLSTVRDEKGTSWTLRILGRDDQRRELDRERAVNKRLGHLANAITELAHGLVQVRSELASIKSVNGPMN